MSAGVRERAFAAIPGWGAELGKHFRTESTRVRLASRETDADVLAEIFAYAERGEQTPIELGHRLLHVRHAHEAHELLAEALTDLANEHSTDRDDLVKRYEAEAVEVLRAELARILDETRELDRALRGIRTAEDVIGKPAAAHDAWVRLGELTSEYAELRATQREIMKVIVGKEAVGALFRAWGSFADALDVVPLWRERRVHAWRDSTDKTCEPLMGWFAEPASDDGWSEVQAAGLSTGIWPDGDHRGHLRWLATKGSPWVPTGREMVALQPLANTATSFVGHLGDQPALQLRALAIVCAITRQPYPADLPSPDALVIQRGKVEPFDAEAAADRVLETTYL